MNRLLEELDKYKRQVRELTQNEGFKNDQFKAENEKFSIENKRLQKHNSELLLAFKKQLKLIDILKRQKVIFRYFLFYLRRPILKLLDSSLSLRMNLSKLLNLAINLNNSNN